MGHITEDKAKKAAGIMQAAEKTAITAAIVVVGNEILSGRTQDKNVAYIAQKLSDVGINLAQVRVIPDIEAEIVDAVNYLRLKYTYVFTTGGIGPTHDDITSASVAVAFGRKFERNPDALKRLRDHYKEELNDARARMADMPRDVDLIDNPVSAAPGFKIDNVFVMAGVPAIMQAMFDAVLPQLKQGKPLKSRTLSTHLPEGKIAYALGEIQVKHPDVSIGSYPFFHEGHVGVSVVLRADDDFALQKAATAVKHLFELLEG